MIRFHRSLKVAPGVRLNLGMRGAGLSVGPRGLHIGLNRRGMYASGGIPGTGLYAVHTFRRGQGAHEVRGSLLMTIALVLLNGAAMGLLVGAIIDG